MELECRKYFICRWITLEAYNHIQAQDSIRDPNKYFAEITLNCDLSGNTTAIVIHYALNGGAKDFCKKNSFRRIDLNNELYEKQQLN